MIIDYSDLIQTKYGLLPSPVEGQPGTFVLMYNPEPVIVWWGSELPQPTLAELDEYAVSPEYLAAWGAKLKVLAEARVNEWSNQSVMALKILEPELFYVAMVANVAFRLLEWNSLGKPEEVDPARFIVTYAEAQAYSETSQSGMTPADLLRLQEVKWTQMQRGFAEVVYKRRLVLEKIKLAPVNENLPGTLTTILAELGTRGQYLEVK